MLKWIGLAGALFIAAASVGLCSLQSEIDHQIIAEYAAQDENKSASLDGCVLEIYVTPLDNCQFDFSNTLIIETIDFSEISRIDSNPFRQCIAARFNFRDDVKERIDAARSMIDAAAPPLPRSDDTEAIAARRDATIAAGEFLEQNGIRSGIRGTLCTGETLPICSSSEYVWRSFQQGNTRKIKRVLRSIHRSCTAEN